MDARKFDVYCSPDRWLLDELNLLDVLARGLAIQRELAADNLNNVCMAAVGELFGGLAGGKAGTIEYGALNELVLLQVGDRLLDGASLMSDLPMMMAGLR